MPHLLTPHYTRHLCLLQIAERRFLRFVHDLQRLVPGLDVSLAGVETNARQRLDCLRMLGNGHSLPDECQEDPVFDSCIDHLMKASTMAQQSARAIESCAMLHRRLINGFRIARAIAERTGRRNHALRIDRLLATMADTFPFWTSDEPEMQPMEVARFAG